MVPPDTVIDQFFVEKSVTREECDDYATREFGGPVKAVQPQGKFSYTVTARGDTVIVQFREKGSPLLAPAMSGLLVRAHGQLVAPSSLVGGLGGLGAHGLDVYRMNKLPGVNCSSMTELLTDEPVAMTAFVESLANFFAQAWIRGRPHTLSSQDRDGLIAGCRARLDALPRSLPDHLLPLVTQVREQIDGLFDEAYPITLTHGDLSELNLLVDEHSGALTGVVDWAEASFLPFGFALYALEHALGAMYLTGWAYHENAHTLRRHFWDNIRASAQPSAAERERMKVARLAGILFRYGTPANTEFPGMLGLGGQNNSSLAFLQAFASSEME